MSRTRLGYLVGFAIALSPLMLAGTRVLAERVRGLPPLDYGGGAAVGGATPTPPTSPTPGPPTETFYVRALGTGATPENPGAGAWDAADFNNAANWTTDDLDDGKIGPGDQVVLIGTDGDIPGLTVQASGTSEKPITIQGRVSTSPVVDGAGATANALLISGKDYIIVQEVEFEGGNGGTSGVVFLTAGADHNIIRNSDIGDSTQNGVLFDATAGPNNTIQGNEIHDNAKSGIAATDYVGSTSLATETLIKDNEIHANTQNGIKAVANYWTIEENNVHDNGSAGAFSGIEVSSLAEVTATGDNVIVRYNLIRDQTGNGNDGSGVSIGRFATSTQVYYNVAYANDGPGFSFNDAPTSVAYNNTSFGNCQGAALTEKAEFRFVSTATDNTTITAKNNIGRATAASAFAVLIDAEVSNNTIVDDTNDWTSSAANFYSFNGTPGNTLATWNALVAGIGTDLNVDPVFESEVTPDLRLDSTSTLIDVGSAVGLTRDINGSFISGVPDLGAYENVIFSLDPLGAGYDAKGHTGTPNSLQFSTCHVTSLLDTAGNPTGAPNTCGTGGGSCGGTFRQCANPAAGRNRPRLIVFDLGGTINITADTLDAITGDTIEIEQPYLTVDCFTAPSPGITFNQVNTGNDNQGGQAIIKIKRTHDIIVQGCRFDGHFNSPDGNPDEVKVIEWDGDTSNKYCTDWDDIPQWAGGVAGACDDCGKGAPDPLDDRKCFGNRHNMISHNTFVNGNDENGALWQGNQYMTRQYNMWLHNFHPAGVVAQGHKPERCVAGQACDSGSCPTETCHQRRQFISDIGNFFWSNGERTPQVREGAYDYDAINNVIGAWRDYSGAAGDSGFGGYGFHLTDPENWRLMGRGNVFLPQHDPAKAGTAFWLPAWDCFLAGDPNASIPCIPGDPVWNNVKWCKSHWSQNLFARAHNDLHCRSLPTGTAPYVRAYPIPVVLNPMDSDDYAGIEALIDGAGMPYPNSEELQAKADAKAAYALRRAQCAAEPSGNGCQQ